MSERRRKQRRRLMLVAETASIQRYAVARYTLFKLRYSLKPKYKVLLSFGFAGITGLGAQVWVPLPFTPIPITMQVFTVLLAGVLLGGVFGSLSQLIYLGLGAAGIPWFSGLKSGLPWTFASGGYVLGFVVAAYVVGKLTDKFIRLRHFQTSLLVMLLGVLIIYGFGLVHLNLFFSCVLGKPLTILETFLYGAIPFIPGDIMKAVVAALIVGVLCPKQPYNGEVDVGKMLTTKTKYVIALSTVLGLAMFILAYFWWSMVGWIKPLNFEFARICLTSSITMIILGIIIGKIFEKKLKTFKATTKP
ncbi:MAG: hypothetical protein DRO36_06410 [Candidatus Hecatellales archaeon]|nr:MAG: hypothetical protein DRO36_06410 [Candidatus Hecatellales archaeon]